MCVHMRTHTHKPGKQISKKKKNLPLAILKNSRENNQLRISYFLNIYLKKTYLSIYICSKFFMLQYMQNKTVSISYRCILQVSIFMGTK